jgi:hypothetical protein
MPMEREKAKASQAAAGGTAPGKLPEAVITGDTRDIVADKVGMSGCFLADSRPGGVLLFEQVVSLSRLTELRSSLTPKQSRRGVRPADVLAIAAPGDEFKGRVFAAINSMMLDMLAAVARKDCDDRLPPGTGDRQGQMRGASTVAARRTQTDSTGFGHAEGRRVVDRNSGRRRV